jgi:hypothetical protein
MTIPLVSLVVVLAGAAGTVTLQAGDWAPGQRAELLTANAPLRALVHALQEDDGRFLLVRHAGGAAASDRATALRNALVALGVPSARIRLEPAAAESGQLVLELAADRRP